MLEMIFAYERVLAKTGQCNFQVVADVKNAHSEFFAVCGTVVQRVTGTGKGNVVINPRRACAVRVIVLGLSFRPSVRLLPHFLPLRATRRPKSDTNGFSATLALF